MKTNTEPIHEHEWMLDERLSAEFDVDDGVLRVYEHCEGTAHPSGDRRHSHCRATRVTTYSLRHVRRDDGTLLSAVELADGAVHESIAERIEQSSLAESWWEPFGGVDEDDKYVHVYCCGEDWTAVFEFDERNVSEVSR